MSQFVATGTVKFFDAQKGYGSFQAEAPTSPSCGARTSPGRGTRAPEQGQRVEFEVGIGKKGDEAQRASDVRVN
jgi:CspA family cold shock protein